MNKEEFNKLNIIDQIKYFNKGIKEYGNSTAVSRALDYKDESTIRKRFKSKGYHLNKEKTAYILINNSETKNNNLNETKVKNNSAIKISNIPETIIKEIQEFKSLKNDIKKVIKWYENFKNENLDTESTKIKINTQRLKNEIAMTRGIKTYPSVYIEFKTFCNEHKEYRMQDLVSMAFLEYIKNHS